MFFSALPVPNTSFQKGIFMNCPLSLDDLFGEAPCEFRTSFHEVRLERFHRGPNKTAPNPV